jgi:tripartite ATP-independent transporter DctP family solute receptor
MKKFLPILIVVLVLSLIVSGCGGAQEATQGQQAKGEEKIVFRMGHVVQEETALHKAAVRMKELMEEKSNGTMTMEIYTNSQLGGNRELIESMQAGTLDFGLPALAFLGGFTDKTAIFDLPYLFKSQEAAEKVLDGPIGQEVAKSVEDKGLVIPAWWTQSWRHLTANKEIRSPQDLKGFKIRVMENPLHIDHFNTLGASAVPMAYSEVLTALQQGVIDGQENPYNNIYQSGFHTVNKYIIETAHIYDPNPVVMSKKTWDSLTEEQQRIVWEAANEAKIYQRQVTNELDDKVKEELKNNGRNVVIELTPEEREQFRQAALPMWEKHADKIGRDLIERVLAAQE